MSGLRYESLADLPEKMRRQVAGKLLEGTIRADVGIGPYGMTGELVAAASGHPDRRRERIVGGTAAGNTGRVF